MPTSKHREKEPGEGNNTATKSTAKEKKASTSHTKATDKSLAASKSTTARKQARKKAPAADRVDEAQEDEQDEKEAKARSNPIRLSLSTKLPERPKPRSSNSDFKGREGSTSAAGKMKSGDEESNLSGSRTKTPYPTFSKAHSKESVTGSVENLTKTRSNAFTPPLTETSLQPDRSKDDLTEVKKKKRHTTTTAATPPSPPLTALDEIPRTDSPARTATPRSDRERAGSRIESNGISQKRTSSLRKSEQPSTTPPSPKARRPDLDRASPSSTEQLPTRSSTSSPSIRVGKTSRTESLRRALTSDRRVGVINDDTTPTPTNISDSTPIGIAARSDNEPSLLAGDDASPADPNSPVTPLHEAAIPSDNYLYAADKTNLANLPPTIPQMPAFPPPPPPPPRPQLPSAVPKVDYLLKNGGLSFTVPKGMSTPTAAEIPLPQLQQLRGGGSGQYPPRAYTSGIPDINAIFTPYSDLLDAYSTVLYKDGSLAVATGHRSVARRLLDRLENVFARDISQEICDCVMCHENVDAIEDLGEEGLGWGEILEWVSGRRGLPTWPAFSISTAQASTDSLAPGLGIDSNGKPMTPAQKLDLSDLPEEWHDHYRRQTQKTKASVDRWLASQPEAQNPAPQEVDDDTLTFAVLTYLSPDDRQLYTALMGNHQDGQTPMPRSPSASVLSLAPSFYSKPRSDFIIQRGLALQRLYHLPQTPRDPEVAVFLLKHPELHNVLTTLSIINTHEWEILISGRFDGFLWNGTEPEFANISPAAPPNTGAFPSRNVSRATNPRSGTPFSRNGTPGPFAPHGAGAPVSIDEDAEIHVLNELERDIFDAMNSIEDAFERLHEQAEGVRRALIDRSSGLMSAAAARRTGTPYSLGIAGATPDITGTPGLAQWTPGMSFAGGGAGGDDDPWENMSVISDLRPDDSASNCFAGRRRRRRRHGEGEPEARTGSGTGTRRKGHTHAHRTPVHGIEEEDEGEVQILHRR